MASGMRVADRCNSGDDRRSHCIGNYRAALKEIAALMDADPAPGTPDGDRLDIIVTLVQAYECQLHPIAASKPMQG